MTRRVLARALAAALAAGSPALAAAAAFAAAAAAPAPAAAQPGAPAGAKPAAPAPATRPAMRASPPSAPPTAPPARRSAPPPARGSTRPAPGSAPARAAPAPSVALSFAEAIDAALRGNAELRIAEAAVKGAEARVDGARAQYLPKLRAEGNVLRWNERLVLDLNGLRGGMMPPPGMSPAEPPVIREQVTASASVSLIQPLSTLIVLSQLVGLEQAGAEAARAEHDRTRLEVGYRAAESYLRVLQARALHATSAKSLAQIEAQLESARAFEAAGALGRVDVLRIEAARDAARQGVIRSEASATTAERALALVLGLPRHARVEVRDDLPDAPRPVPWTEEEAVRLALERRPELRAAAERVAQADAGRKAALVSMLPNVVGVATFQHNEGTGSFQPENAWFVGVSATWDVWDWGKSTAAVREARHRQTQASIVAENLADGVVLDARRRVLDAHAGYETLGVGRSALQAAEEAYRIQSVRFREGAATTTDLLESETEVARARTGFAVARYEYFIALVALARAVGEVPGDVR